ncbi:MAG: right-handed parallel beta-helix repeat-containing protein, partial [Candidatus Sungiibacteriota bacterium]
QQTQSTETPATSTPPSAPPPSDTTPPDIAFAIAECVAGSLSSDGCLLANSALHLSWSSAANDFEHFEVTCEVNGSPCAGFSFSPTSATSTEYATALENKLYTFKAKAIDAAGNISAEETRTAVFSALPIVINEVAWMGTGSSATTSKDEWLELYNNTDYSVNLSGWTLSFFKPATTSPSKTVSLTGTIAAKGFYLIERTDDNVITDIPADLPCRPEDSLNPCSFGDGLLNGGMIVKLERGSAVIDRTPELCIGGWGLQWCAGSTSNYYATMERVESLTAGDMQSNWGTALGEFILNGTNADGGPIKGTPKKSNSASHLISQTSILSQNKTLIKANSPYLIPRYGLTVQPGVTLTIEPGVVIKFVVPNEPSLVVNGTIQSNGTAAEPVVFTAFADDTYGGDMNADGICDPGNASSTAACPAPGNWMQVFINSSSAGSRFDNTIFRYGGRWFTNMTFRAMVVVSGTSATFRNSTFEYSQKHGLYLNSSDSMVEANTFRNNNVDAESTGLYTTGGSPTIQQNIFIANSYGLYIVGGVTPQVAANTFSQNTGKAIVSVASPAIFSGNTANNNGTNGILLYNAPPQDYTFKKDLPYVIGGSMGVNSGNTFTIEPGVIVKGGASWSIGGKFIAKGTAAEPIIFTSLKDDLAGGDTNNDGICDPGNASSTAACPSPGDWMSLIFQSTSVSSTISNAIIRYGSSYLYCGFSGGAVIVNGTSIAVADTTFEKNKAAGLWLNNSASTTISSATFLGHQGSDCAVGLKLTGSNAFLDGVIFSDNRLGIYAEGASSVTLGGGGVTFINNTASTSPSNLIP